MRMRKMKRLILRWRPRGKKRVENVGIIKG